MWLCRGASLVPVLVAGLGAFASAQTFREKVAVEVVTIRVTARDASGRPVRDLTAGDLSLAVDDKATPIETFSALPAVAPASGEGARAAEVTPSRRLPRPEAIAFFADEAETSPLDQSNVYRELVRFLSTPGQAGRRYAVVRFFGGPVTVECPWTEDPREAAKMLGRMRAHPRFSRIPTISERTKDTGLLEIDAIGLRLSRALLETIALFPSDASVRRLVFVSGGTSFAPLADLAADPVDPDARTFNQAAQRDPFPSLRRAENAQTAFALWTSVVNPGRLGLTTGDVVAKAIEADVELITLFAEPDRIIPDGIQQDLVRSTGPKLSPRLGVAQAMWGIAQSTGAEPILLPGKTAERLGEIEGRAAYELTFRDPSRGGHGGHRVALICKRPGVRIEYRRGYRIPTDEDRILDTVVARLVAKMPAENPLAALVALSASERDGKSRTRVTLAFTPPRERQASGAREIEWIGVGEDDDDERTEPVHWAATARPGQSIGSFESESELAIPYGRYRWSFAVRDGPTGLISYVAAGP
jgi:VWFA-related protein